jgi:UrcA family protein
MNDNSFAHRLGMGTLALGATLLTATLLQATIVSSANAAEAPKQQVISLRGLDLGRPTDVAALYDRIRTAARTVCSAGPVTGSPRNAVEARCIAASVESAVATIDKAPLTAMHREASAFTADKLQARG